MCSTTYKEQSVITKENIGNSLTATSSCFCLPNIQSFTLSLQLCKKKKNTSVSCKTQTHTYTQSSPQQVLYSLCAQCCNYRGRKSVPSPIIISLLHYPQSRRGCLRTLLHMTLSTRQPYLRPFQSIFHRLTVRMDFTASRETLQPFTPHHRDRLKSVKNTKAVLCKEYCS